MYLANQSDKIRFRHWRITLFSRSEPDSSSTVVTFGFVGFRTSILSWEGRVIRVTNGRVGQHCGHGIVLTRGWRKWWYDAEECHFSQRNVVGSSQVVAFWGRVRIVGIRHYILFRILLLVSLQIEIAFSSCAMADGRARHESNYFWVSLLLSGCLFSTASAGELMRWISNFTLI